MDQADLAILVAIGAALALTHAWVLLSGQFVDRREIDELLQERPTAGGFDPRSLVTRRPRVPRVIAALLQPVTRAGGYRDLPAESPMAWAEQLRKRLPEVYRATASQPNVLIVVLCSSAFVSALAAGLMDTSTLLFGAVVILASVIPVRAAWRHRTVCEHALTELLSQVLAPPAAGAASAPSAPIAPGACPKCGRQNQPSWRFCLDCGAELLRPE